jgi:hypothetical protein
MTGHGATTTLLRMTTAKRDNSSTAAAPTRVGRPLAGRTLTMRGLSVLGAVAAALAVWVVAAPIAGRQLKVRQGGVTDTVGLRAVIVTALIAGLVGWALLAVLERFGRRPRPTWTVIAVVVLALSLAGPLAEGVDAATKLVLACMHLAVGAVLIPTLLRMARRR